MIVYIVTFKSFYYPEDSRVIGAYATAEKANSIIKDAIEADRICYPEYPARDEQSELNYNIDEFEVDN